MKDVKVPVFGANPRIVSVPVTVDPINQENEALPNTLQVNALKRIARQIVKHYAIRRLKEIDCVIMAQDGRTPEVEVVFTDDTSDVWQWKQNPDRNYAVQFPNVWQLVSVHNRVAA